MIKVGIVGIGFMGMIHYLALRSVRGARVTAICSRSKKKRTGDWRGIQGNFGPPGEEMDLGGVAAYGEWEELLADPAIDLVDICLPPNLHADVTVAALRAGKHVLCEKPIALITRDADRMVRAAEKSGRQLFIGHVLPFFPEYALARKAIAGGRYGRLLGGSFKRIISNPKWLKDFFNPDKVGGPVVDLHIHDAHFIRLTCGMPRSVRSIGRMRGDVVEFFNSQFRFDDERLAVTATSGVIDQQGRPFTHAFEIYMERATLLFDYAAIGGQDAGIPLAVLTSSGRVQHPQLAGGDPTAAFTAELTEAVQCIRKNRPSNILDGRLARDALLMCHRQTQAVRSGRDVRI